MTKEANYVTLQPRSKPEYKGTIPISELLLKLQEQKEIGEH